MPSLLVMTQKISWRSWMCCDVTNRKHDVNWTYVSRSVDVHDMLNVFFTLNLGPVSRVGRGYNNLMRHHKDAHKLNDNPCRQNWDLNPLGANITKKSNTLIQFVDKLLKWAPLLKVRKLNERSGAHSDNYGISQESKVNFLI